MSDPYESRDEAGIDTLERLERLLPTEAHLEVVLAHYGETHRRYHTLGHVDAVLRAIDRWYPDAGDAIRLAGVYHDVIYIPGADDNERRSAELAVDALVGYLPAADVALVHHAIAATAHHDLRRVMARAVPLVVADLIGMDCPVEEYRETTARIRAEYARFDDAQWAQGRRAFVERLLARRLLPEEPRFDGPEARIRANWADELARLPRVGP